MARELQLGDRVRLTGLGIARSPRTTTRSEAVVALPRYRSGTVHVLLDGNQRPTAMHRSYVELDIDVASDSLTLHQRSPGARAPLASSVNRASQVSKPTDYQKVLPSAMKVPTGPSVTPTRTSVRINRRCGIRSRCCIDRILFHHHSGRRD